MDSIKLIFAKKPRQGEVCYLKPLGEELALLDASDKLVARINRDEAMLRIHLPSFWSSRYIVIDGDDGNVICFEPKPKAIEKLQAMFEGMASAEQSGGMAQACYRSGMRDLLIGGGSLVLGIILSVISFNLAAPGGSYWVMTGLIGVGIIEILRGISNLTKSDNLRRMASSQESYFTIACSVCRAPMRVNSKHAGQRVICPQCKTSLLVPGEPDDEDNDSRRTRRKRKKVDVPVWVYVASGALVLVLFVGIVWYFSGDNSGKVVMSTTPFTMPPRNQPNEKQSGKESRPGNNPEAGIHPENEIVDAQLDGKRPFPVDPVLKEKSGAIYLGDMNEFADKEGADGWSFGKHGKLKKNSNRADIIVNGKPVKEGLGMHPPHVGFARVAYVLGKNGNRIIGSVGMGEDQPHFTPQPTRFVILGDGKRLWRSKSISGFGLQEAFDVDISNVDILELRVYSETFNITGSHAVWIDPQVILKEVR